MSTPEKRMPHGQGEASAEDKTERRDIATSAATTTGAERLVLTRAECNDLAKNARLRGSVAKADAKARGAQQLADFEIALDHQYPANHPSWAAMIAEAKASVAVVQAKLATQCDELGIPKPFRPHFDAYWSGRGENAHKERRAELRRIAQTVVEANVKKTCLEIDRSLANIQTRLLSGLVLSADARACLESLPSIAELLPAPTLASVELLAQG